MSFLILLIVLMIGYILVTYNAIITRKNKIKQAKSTIDVYLTQRFELIPNLVECVKGYMKHETKVLEKVTALRNDYNTTKNLKSGAKLNNVCNHMLGIGENHPDLKASEQFANLQKSLAKMESQLQAARRIYNAEVTVYNTKIATIPTNIIASLFGFKEEELWQAEENAKENIEMDW